MLKDPVLCSERAPPDDGALQSRPKEEGSPGNLREEWKRKGSRPCLEMVLLDEDEERKKGRRRRSGSNSVSPMSVRSSFTESPNTPAGLGQFGSLRLRPSNYVKAVEDRLVKVMVLLLYNQHVTALAATLALYNQIAVQLHPAPLLHYWLARTVTRMLTCALPVCADWQARQGLQR
jgi:hypothetical protein